MTDHTDRGLSLKSNDDGAWNMDGGTVIRNDKGLRARCTLRYPSSKAPARVERG